MTRNCFVLFSEQLSDWCVYLDRPTSIATQKAQAPVLVVDLDETLSRTDTLHEALIRVSMDQPNVIWRLIASRPRDKAAFKDILADTCVMAPDQLVFNSDVVRIIEEARAAGKKTVLVSAADDRQVRAVADHLGIFDEAFGTGATKAAGYNLGGQRKADFLTDRYGAEGFDYIGDCVRDIPVWQAAKTAYAVAPSSSLQDAAARAGVTLEAVGARTDGIKPFLKALRPHQWVKNILIFLPILTAQQFDMVWFAIIAFVLFSLTASSVYVFNDLADLPADREHKRKRARPFASGDIPLAQGVIMGLGLLIFSFLASLIIMPPMFTLVLAIYFAVTVAYSFFLKRKLIVDIIVLAGLYTVRIIAGGAATGIVPSPWLLAFSVFLFYALAGVKRQAELIDQATQNKNSTPGRGYVASDVSVIQMVSISSGQAAVLVFALYLYSPSVAKLYNTPEVLWLICPILLYWLSRIAVLTHRGFMHDDPIVFATRDRISLLTAAIIVVIVFAAEWNW